MRGNHKELIYLNEQNIANAITTKTPLKRQPIEFIITESYANRLSLKDAIINILYSKYLAGDKEVKNAN